MAARPAKATPQRAKATPQRAKAASQRAKATPSPAKATRQRAKAASPPAQAPAGAPAGTPAAGTPAAGTPAAGTPAAGTPAAGTALRPAGLRVAAAVQATEAVGMGVAAAFSAYSTAEGRSYQLVSGIALTLIALGTAAAFAVFAAGLARARPWSRIPVVMSQLFVVIAGLTLLDGHRPEWGVPALLLAATCLIALFTPAALRALNRPPHS